MDRPNQPSGDSGTSAGPPGRDLPGPYTIPVVSFHSATGLYLRFVRGESRSSRVFENTIAAAFLDISPVNRGHTLVIPLRHVASFADLTLAEVDGMARMAQQVASALKSAFPECEGVTVSVADGAIAGQEVPHAHMHVIPRHRDDGFGWRRFGNSMDREQLDAMASEIRRAVEVSSKGRALGLTIFTVWCNRRGSPDWR